MGAIDSLSVCLISGLAACCFLYLANKGAGKSVLPNAVGQFRLRIHWLYGATGYISLLVGFVMQIILIVTERPETGLYIMAFVFFLVFGGLGVWGILFFRNYSVGFDSTQFEVRSCMGRVKKVSWSEIQNIKFNTFTGYLTVVDIYGQQLKVHQHLVGLGRFVAFMEDHTRWTAEALKLPVKRTDTE